MSFGVALLDGLAVPLYRRGVVLRHAPPIRIHETEVVLSIGIALRGSLAKPLHRLGVVLGDAAPC